MESLAERIGKALTPGEIENFMKEGETYKFATKKTRVKWKKNATNRLNSFKEKEPKKEKGK